MQYDAFRMSTHTHAAKTSQDQAWSTPLNGICMSMLHSKCPILYVQNGSSPAVIQPLDVCLLQPQDVLGSAVTACCCSHASPAQPSSVQSAHPSLAARPWHGHVTTGYAVTAGGCAAMTRLPPRLLVCARAAGHSGLSHFFLGWWRPPRRAASGRFSSSSVAFTAPAAARATLPADTASPSRPARRTSLPWATSQAS